MTMISFTPFWKTLKDSGKTTYTLINKYDISSATISRLRNNKGITPVTVNDLCKILECRVEDILEFIKD